MHTPTPNPQTPVQSIVSRLTSGVGSTIVQGAQYAAMTAAAGALLSAVSSVGGGPGHVADEFIHSAGDAGHWLATLPGDIRHGVEESFHTARNITYLLTAGAIIGGAIYLYKQ